MEFIFSSRCVVAGSEELNINAVESGVLVAEGSEAWTYRITPNPDVDFFVDKKIFC